MLISVRILYVPKWKDTPVPTMEEWMEKGMELAEITKLIVLIKGKNVSSFVST